jgi:hypothetical protein
MFGLHSRNLRMSAVSVETQEMRTNRERRKGAKKFKEEQDEEGGPWHNGVRHIPCRQWIVV